MRTLSKPIAFLSLLTIPGLAAAQQTKPAQESASPLLWLMILIIILLAFAISAVAGAIRNISAARTTEEHKQSSAGNKIAGLAILFFLFSQSLSATTPPGGFTGGETVGGIPFGQFYFLAIVIGIELAFLFTLLSVLKNRFTVSQPVRKAAKVAKEKTILEKINASVELEKEEDILLEHDYDGIQELDNNLPPWWKYGFYVSIIAAVAYMVHYHVTKTGDLQLVELEKQITEGNREVEEYLKTSASNVDELTVKYLDNSSDLGAGKEIFVNSCSACHGSKGEGNIGPNLADDYWLHGGSISDIFKSVKYGWTDKGMKSWKEELSPIKIAQVSSFIKSLKGTNPPNGKEKQGDLYTEGGTGGATPTAPPADTTRAAAAEDAGNK